MTFSLEYWIRYYVFIENLSIQEAVEKAKRKLINKDFK